MAFSGGVSPDDVVAPVRQKAQKPQPKKRAPAKPATPTPRRQAPRRPVRPPNPIYDPSQPLQGRSLQQAAQALTDLEINPQISELAKQIARNNRQSERVIDLTGTYYRTFGDQAGNLLKQQQDLANQNNATLANIGTQTQQAMQQAGQSSQNALQPLVDKGLDGGAFAKIAEQAAQQQAAAAQGSQAAQQFGALQGGNYTGLTGSTNATGLLRGQERLGEIGNAFAMANQQPYSDIADLRKSRGAIMTKNIGSLRDSERNYDLAVNTLGADVQKAQLSAQSDAADRKLRKQVARLNAVVQMRGQDINRMVADRTFRLNVQKVGYEQAADTYMREHGLGRYRVIRDKAAREPSLSPTQVNNAWSQIDAAKSAISNLRSYGLTTAQIRDALTNGSFRAQTRDGRPILLRAPRIDGGGYGDYVNTAMDIALKGYISPANIRALHRQGLKIGNRYRVWRPLPSDVAGPSRPN